MDGEFPIIIRQGIEQDVPFVISSWLKSYRQSNSASSMEGDTYFSTHGKAIKHLLPYFRSAIACDPDNIQDIYGYIVYHESVSVPIIHYIYVKKHFRTMKIATRLLDIALDGSKEFITTHATEKGRELFESTKKKNFYVPSCFYIPNILEV